MEQIRISEPRNAVRLTFADGRVFEGPVDTPLEAFLRAAFEGATAPPLAALVDGSMRELSWKVARDTAVRPIGPSDSEGIRIYTRSLSFLLVAVTLELFPGARLIIDHSVPFGGYYCRVVGRGAFTDEELGRIEDRMRELVEADAPILHEDVPVEEVQRWFREHGMPHKADLLREGNASDPVRMYELGPLRDTFFGPMVTSCGPLKWFGLSQYHDGFILRFPRRERPTELAPEEDYRPLWEVFQEHVRWLELLSVYDAWTVNEAVASGRMREVVLVSEALHELRIGEIARTIASRRPEERHVVLVSGPSSAGKTTFTKRLAIQLLAQGLRPYPVAMDDYFLPRAEMQRRGMDDFDDISAVDLPSLHKDMRALLGGEAVRLPRFDFRTGERQAGMALRLTPGAVVLIEGLHALNPAFLPEEMGEQAFRIYVSALTQLKLDDHVRLPSTDTRLVRRLVRDVAFRGYDPEATLKMWSNVRRGEKRNVFPYQGRADVMFNSALAYEWSVLRPLVEPLLLQVRHPRHRLEAQRVLNEICWFRPYPQDDVPATSILREFTGGGVLKDYFPDPLERAARRHG